MFWRPRSGRTGLTYEEAVQEALCFGWIDGKAAKLDDQRTMLRFSPRKRGSGWARTNKVRIERLLAEGLMAEPGLALIEEAKRDGSWTMLDAVEDLIVPDDLAAAFDDHPGRPRAVGRLPPVGAPGRPGVDRPGQAPRDPGQAGHRDGPPGRQGRAPRPGGRPRLSPPRSAAHALQLGPGRRPGRRGRLRRRRRPPPAPACRR